MSDGTTRRRFLTVAGSGAAAALAGCSGNQPNQESTPTSASDDGSTDSTPTPQQIGEPVKAGGPKGTLRMASPGPFQTLDPIVAKGSGAGWPQYSEMLMKFKNGDLPPVANLAKDYTVSEDGKTYTFTLKEGVTFHDGSELTAHDFVYSWRRLAGSDKSRNKDDIIGGTFTIAHEGNTSESLENYKSGSLAVEAKSDYEFAFTLESPFHAAISQISGGAFAVLPENAVGDIEGYDGKWDYDEFFSTSGDGPKFVATGPFQVDTWTKGDELLLTAYDDYHGETANIENISYTVISSESTRFKRFKNGNLDILENGMPTSKFQPDRLVIDSTKGDYETGRYELENGDVVHYGQATTLDTRYLVFNCDNVERPARQAIAYIINQQSIADDLYKGLAQPAYHLTPPPVYMHKEGEEPTANYDKHAKSGFRSETEFGADGYPYGIGTSDIASAKQVMEDAGYSQDNMYEMEFTVESGNNAVDQLSKRVRDKARAAHINITIQKADFGTIISKAIKGTMDFFTLSDGMEWPESDNFLRFLHAGNPSSAFTRWGGDSGHHNDEYVNTARNAWTQYYQPNTGPGTAAQQKRNKAYTIIEEMNWASVQELPTVHTVSQRLWYDDVDVRMYGAMENQTFNRLELQR
ncbi:ABC transporter substrate-binding protein [Halobaculum sp. D14]|uniref:ABC transporter substrate-binding protein n=1 Tax=unclassified Halobaculum TaxID=2640896 RepID=UPI003EBDD46C